MRRHWWVPVPGLALFTAVGVAVWWGSVSAPAPGPRLQVENYPQVRVGMTRAEVEELFGGPAGDYGRNAGGSTEVIGIDNEGPPGSVQEDWYDDAKRLVVYFDGRGRVVGYYKEGHLRRPPAGFFWRLWR